MKLWQDIFGSTEQFYTYDIQTQGIYNYSLATVTFKKKGIQRQQILSMTCTFHAIGCIILCVHIPRDWLYHTSNVCTFHAIGCIILCVQIVFIRYK